MVVFAEAANMFKVINLRNDTAHQRVIKIFITFKRQTVTSSKKLINLSFRYKLDNINLLLMQLNVSVIFFER